MNTYEKALLASSPGLTVLVVSLAWFALDPKGDARQHLIDRAVRTIDATPRLITRLRDAARL